MQQKVGKIIKQLTLFYNNKGIIYIISTRTFLPLFDRIVSGERVMGKGWEMTPDVMVW